MSCEKNILATGFGPFGPHKINASWVGVQELTQLWKDRPSKWQSYKLVTREIPVSYSYVNEKLEGIYKDTSPDLCIHVGVSPYDIIMLEKVGRNIGYSRQDAYGETQPDGIIKMGGPNAILTTVPIEEIQSRLSSAYKDKDVEFGISADAGRYLCDFIYYSSLILEKCPVLFVHVPPLGKPYTSKQLGLALKDIIEIVLDVTTS